ncbi:TlpA family protein disulfide reductase [Alteromonas pelagimontana]|uniref:TlpA family protein disulfide reductase n=1 Tax=Alteromonas pelagimontana TaxID=1858656 RepID=A0A6M4MB42_9ALTE|nr:TlpA disulfide reductase family protein [Alteromonas pelagimontana]QJR79376.1 TlpA family protein disulfide reductase [Alteromonas pelagimontana]
MGLQNSSINIAGFAKPVFFAALAILAVSTGALTYQFSRYDIQTLHGERYRWQALEGKWVIVNYFAQWCAPCLRELPELNSLNQSLPEDVVLLGINFDPMTETQARAMAEKHNISFDVIIADNQTSMPMTTPQYLPATYIINPKGQVAIKLAGEQTEAGLLETLNKLKLQTL